MINNELTGKRIIFISGKLKGTTKRIVSNTDINIYSLEDCFIELNKTFIEKILEFIGFKIETKYIKKDIPKELDIINNEYIIIN